MSNFVDSLKAIGWDPEQYKKSPVTAVVRFIDAEGREILHRGIRNPRIGSTDGETYVDEQEYCLKVRIGEAFRDAVYLQSKNAKVEGADV